METILNEKFNSLKQKNTDRVFLEKLKIKIKKEGSYLEIYPMFKFPINIIVYIISFVITYILIMIPISIIVAILDNSHILDTDYENGYNQSVSVSGLIYESAYKLWFIWLFLFIYLSTITYKKIEKKMAYKFYSNKWKHFVKKYKITNFKYQPNDENNLALNKLLKSIENK